MAHAFDHRNASLSEGEALAVVVQAVPGNPYWTRVGTDCPRRLRQPWQGGGWRVPASSRAPRLEGEEVVRATPRATYSPRYGEVALTTVIPDGKATNPPRSGGGGRALWACRELPPRPLQDAIPIELERLAPVLGVGGHRLRLPVFLGQLRERTRLNDSERRLVLKHGQVGKARGE